MENLNEYVQYASVILTLIVLEGLLSADNALVLAVMVKHLPGEQRAKALRYGIWGAFFFRAVGILLAATLIRFWYLKALGALYLLLLAAKHFWQKHKQKQETLGEVAPKLAGFWMTVLYVELTDIAFSIDSIVAAVALSDNKIIVYIGGVLGIITMRFVAGYFLKLLDRFPSLESAAYLLVGWIGLKLGLESGVQGYHSLIGAPIEGHVHVMPAWLFWSVMAIVFLSAFIRGKKEEERAEGAEAIEDLARQEDASDASVRHPTA